MTLRPENVLRIGIPWQDLYAMGAGKASLLEAIRDTGSISAAGRRLGLSYRKAWQMVDTMNQAFRKPLVETAKGGAKGGGAYLTDLGQEVLEAYRNLQARAWKSLEPAVGQFCRFLKSETK